MGCDWWISILVCLACRKTMSGDVFGTITDMHVTLKVGENSKPCRSFNENVAMKRGLLLVLCTILSVASQRSCEFTTHLVYAYAMCLLNFVQFHFIRRKSRGPQSAGQQQGSSESAQYPTARGLLAQQKRVLPQ